ncbi:MAG: hypothetical protein V1816_02595 [Pseudomonadota bacterium]
MIEPGSFFAGMAGVGEAGLWSAALFGFFIGQGLSWAESAAYALFSTCLAFSFLFQASFLAGVPGAAPFVEGPLTLAALAGVYKYRAGLAAAIRDLDRFRSANQIVCYGLLLGTAYLAALALVAPPSPAAWDDLVKILFLERRGVIPLASSLRPDLNPEGNFLPLNQLILPHLFLRWSTDFGIGLFGLLGYFIIAFSTYALARRFAWPPTALVVALIVMSAPRLVLLAPTPGLEILYSASALFSLLALFRLVEQPGTLDLFFLAWGLLFVQSGHPLCLAVQAILTALAAVVLHRRHGPTFWRPLVRQNRLKTLAALVPALVFSQIPLYLNLVLVHGLAPGPPGFGSFPYNREVIKGALANLVRYLLESFHLTRPVDFLSRYLFNFSPQALVQHAYYTLLDPLFGNAGQVYPFHLRWVPSQQYSWFGPFGFFLVLPALGYALVRGNRRVKAAAVAWIGYCYLAALIPAWKPDNAALFTVFFVGAGFLTAFFLPPWRFSLGGRRRLKAAALLLFFYGLSCNAAQPLLDYRRAAWESPDGGDDASRLDGFFGRRVFSDNIWIKSEWGRNRLVQAEEFFGDDRVRQAALLLKPGGEVLAVAARDGSLYPFIMARPDLDFESATARLALESSPTLPQAKYLLFPDQAPGVFTGPGRRRVIWVSAPDGRAVPGALLDLDPGPGDAGR